MPPGDSILLDLGVFYSEVNFFGQGDSVNRQFCDFTSYPNELTNLVVGNGAYCEDFFLGIADFPENPKSEKEVVKMFDQLGREVEQSKNQFVIVLYTDRSTEKRYILD